MDETLLASLSLAEKAEFIQENGQFIEAQDFYSFFILVYILNQQHLKICYDFTGLLVSIEGEKQGNAEDYISSQLEQSLEMDM
jgi:hypothetical protein